MAAEQFPIYLAGKWVTSDQPLAVNNPYDGSMVGETWLASTSQLETAIVAAEEAFETLRVMPVYERVTLLQALAAKLRQHRDDIARTITLESGKPIRDAEVETDRGIFTLETAAEEAKRIGGEVIPLDLIPSSRGRSAVVKRFPIGPIAGISPFNFPLNLALHKLAPALASGNPLVLKPPTRDPLTMLKVARLADEVGLPAGALSVLPMDRQTGDAMVSDERFRLLSFTGSPNVGWDMKARAGRKKVVLELGGNAGVIVDRDADLAYAANRVRVGAFAYSGQVCISVQRVFVHDDVYDEFVGLLVAETGRIVMGNPLDRATDVGPMIDEAAIRRTTGWIDDAVQGGAKLLAGGTVDGQFLAPTIIEGAKRSDSVCSEEAFAPVLTLFRVGSMREAVAGVNDSVFGLQAGVFTNRLERALFAWEEIEAGGVVINDIPTYRIDHMPYGGVKDSGLGREGLKYAIEDMTEPRIMVLNRLESERAGLDG